MQNLGPYEKLNNPFWREVLGAWQYLQNIQNNSQINTCHIRKNNKIKIGNHSVLYKDLTKRGLVNPTVLICLCLKRKSYIRNERRF